MKLFTKTLAASALASALWSGPTVAEVYKVTSIAPGLSPFVVTTAIAKVVNKYVDNVDFR